MTRVPLGAVASVVSGFAFKSELFNDSGEGLPLVRIRDVTVGASDTFYSGSFRDEFVVSNGDALIGMDGEFNLGLWRGGRALLNQRVCKVQASDNRVSQEYLIRFLPRALKAIEERTPFVTVKHLSVKDLREIEVPLPPLKEQRRIAAILDKADALRAKRRGAIAKLDQLQHSLFFDMFGDPATNPKGWREMTFGEMFHISSSKRVLESQWREEGIPFYRAREIVKLAKQGFVENDLFISEQLFEDFKEKSGAPEPGDLMVSAVGTLGACYQVQAGDRFYFKDASVLRFRPKEGINPTFIQFSFGTDHVLRQVHSGSGSTVGTYTIARANETRIFVPPLDLQNRFAAFVDAVTKRKATLTQSLSKSEELFGAIQRDAFSGGR